MEINSKTIIRSLLGSVIHIVKCIQMEKKIEFDQAKGIAYTEINNEILRLLELDDTDNFLASINQLIQMYKSKDDKTYTLLLQIKQMYKERKS